MAKNKKVVEQAIAVFGESGSGKSVLVSSFYGATQEPSFIKESRYTISAPMGQHTKLFQDYLGMKDYARLPATTRTSATAYSFSVRVKKPQDPKKQKRGVDTLHLIWHDYPGQWFEQDVSGESEAQRRVDAFRDLLGSDVALLLVDAQRLIDNKGQEVKYLKSLFSNIRNGLTALKEQLLPDDKRLEQFPRTWILALSKADLLPEMDVIAFRDLVVANAGADLDRLRSTIVDMIEAPEATSVFDDLVLLSSARFQPERIEVGQRVGLDLILPFAAILPLEKIAWWKKAGALPMPLLNNLTKANDGIVGLAVPFLMKKAKDIPGPIGEAAARIIGAFAQDALEGLMNAGANKLQEKITLFTQEQENFKAMLADFRLRLINAEEEHVLYRRVQ